MRLCGLGQVAVSRGAVELSLITPFFAQFVLESARVVGPVQLSAGGHTARGQTAGIALPVCEPQNSLYGLARGSCSLRSPAASRQD